jgi:HSP20 family protein
MKSILPWKKQNSNVSVRRSGAINPFEVLHQEMNELFDSFFKEFGKGWAMPALQSGLAPAFGDIVPNVDVAENEKEIQITTELPGIDEKDVEVFLNEGMLTIRGEKKKEHDEKSKNYRLTERSYGSFERSIPLPSGIDGEHIKANFKKGVLTIAIPKTETSAANRRKIAISGE